MKIAIITSGFLPVVDGVTVTLWHRLQILSQYHHQVLVFCPNYAPISQVYPNWQVYVGEIFPKIQLIPLASEPFMGLEFERNVTQKSYHDVLEALQEFQPDIIHVDEPERLFLGFLKAPGVDFARKNNIPCIGFYHTNFVDYIEDFIPLPQWAIAPLQWLSKQIIHRVFNAYDLTLVASRSAHQIASKMGIRNVLCDRFLGVDIEAYHSSLRDSHFFQTHYNLPDADPKLKLLFLGRLTPDKGWNFLLRALACWKQLADLDRVALLIAGDGSMRDEIAHQLRQLKIPTHFLGRVAPDAIPALLMNSDIHITASEKETRGLTIFEACAAALPVLAPRAGGVTETISDSSVGMLFEPRDETDFSQKLQYLIDNPALRHDMGKQGQKWVAELSWDNAVRCLLDYWQSQIDAKPQIKQSDRGAMLRRH